MANAAIAGSYMEERQKGKSAVCAFAFCYFFLKTGKQAAAMILLDIAAPICLLLGRRSESAANVSLLNNFEIVATALIVLAVFKEKISLRLWAGILFVVLSCALLSASDF